jgi:4-amino-4-deoxy-L-arabinose transferase-like glycosyltransferase
MSFDLLLRRLGGLSRRPNAAPLGQPTLAQVLCGLLVFGAVWLGLLSAGSLAPPFDNIEQLLWVRSLEWGYYKHPPLPTWLLWGPAQVFGVQRATAEGLGATLTLGALLLFWALLRRLRGAGYATLALAATVCIPYYNGRLNFYNHNTLLLCAVVASAYCNWRAFDTRRLHWWAALGLVMGLGALSKYQIAVTAVSLLCFWLSQRAWRDAVHRQGLALAALVSLVVMTPHLLWLPAHDFGPIGYAMSTSLGLHLGPLARSLNALNWEFDQLFNRGLPALLLLGACAWTAARVGAGHRAAAATSTPAPSDPARALILCWSVVPLAFIPAMGLAFGSELQSQWGTAFLLFAVPALMELRPPAFWVQVSRRQLLGALLVLQGLLLLLNYATSPIGFDGLKDRHWRSFDAPGLADQLAGPARTALQGPIRVVVGDMAMAGALALQLPEKPLVLIDGDLGKSPWVTADRVHRCGALQLASRSAHLAGMAPVGPEFPELVWRVLPPAGEDAPCVDTPD